MYYDCTLRLFTDFTSENFMWLGPRGLRFEGAPWLSSNLTILLLEDDCFLIEAPYFSLER